MAESNILETLKQDETGQLFLEIGPDKFVPFLEMLSKVSPQESSIHSTEHLKDFIQLGSLRFRGVNVDSLPCLNSLSKLTALALIGCFCTTLPETIWTCHEIVELVCKGNDLRDFPLNLLQLRNLKSLDISWNQIDFLPESFEQLRNLTSLNVRWNKIGTLPSSIGQLKNLTSLDASYNGINKVTESIIQLDNLTYLDVSNNCISYLSPVLLKCKNLNKLNVCANELRSLANFFEDNKKWQTVQQPYYTNETLKIEECSTSVETSNAGHLSNLTALHLSRCDIRGLPYNVGKLKNLTSLYVSYNALEYLPGSIGELVNLTLLDVSFNQINNFPIEMTNCELLLELKAEGNPCREIPKTVIDGGTKAIMTYLRSVIETTFSVSHRKNVMLLGNTMAGKTSFVRSLLNKRASPSEEEDRTHVVDKYAWQSDPQLDIQIFDFGGHECYYITNVIFWNESSLFMIVFNLAKYDQSTHDELVGQWVLNLTDKIESPKIMFIGSHKDKLTSSEIATKLDLLKDLVKRDEDTKLKQLKTQMSGILTTSVMKEKLNKVQQHRPVFLFEGLAVSSKTSDGIEGAGDVILEHLRHTDLFPTKHIPKLWTELSLRLKAEKSDVPWISWDRILFLASPQYQGTGMHIDAVKQALRYMWQNGDIMWYEDTKLLSQIVFHQPTKLIAILKEVISHDFVSQIAVDDRFSGFSDKHLQQIRDNLLSAGIVSKDVLRCIWCKYLPKDVVSSRESLNVLVELMVRFEMAYLLPRRSNVIDMSVCKELMIPWFLQGNKPVLDWLENMPADSKQATIIFQFLQKCPLPLMSNLCVRLQKYVHKAIGWKTGMYARLFTSDNYEMLIELTKGVESNYDQDDLTVSVRTDVGAEVWQIALEIQRETENLIKQWPGVVYAMTILNPCSASNIGDCASNIDLASQFKDEQRNYLHLSLLVINLGTQKVLNVLENHVKNTHSLSLHEWLHINETNFRQRLSKYTKWISRKLYPLDGSVKLAELDVTVLNTIFTKLATDFPPPHKGWSNDPDPTDLSQAADIMRLCKLRNGPHLAHNPACQISQQVFDELWCDAKTILLRLDPASETEIARFTLNTPDINGPQ